MVSRGIFIDARSRWITLRRMIRRLFVLGFAVLSLPFAAFSQQPKSLFYLSRDPQSVRSFIAHVDQIDLLVPAWYSVDASGLVWGGPNPLVLETAREHRVPVMPIIVNDRFLEEDFHKLLANPNACGEMSSELLRASRENGYAGFQLDFENVNWTDGQALSKMVEDLTAAFHQQNLKLSMATVPNMPGTAGQTGFSAWLFEHWRGAYDLASLGRSVDFLCLMTYDQHTRWTAPGPVAGWEWTVRNIDYALRFIPAEKIFLGIPLYGYHWFAGTPMKPDYKPNPSAQYISTPDALDLARAYGGHIEWDPVDRTAWFYFYRDDMREWVFYTEARAFRERLELAKQRKLGGFSAWVLGTEDPGIWDLLPRHK
jgi:spore germination protein YaaH